MTIIYDQDGAPIGIVLVAIRPQPTAAEQRQASREKHRTAVTCAKCGPKVQAIQEHARTGHGVPPRKPVAVVPRQYRRH